MKFFKNTLAVVVLFAASSVLARNRAGATPTTKQTETTTPTQEQKQTRSTQQRATSGKTYAQLVTFVKNAKAAEVWDNTAKKLKAPFADKIAQMALDANLEGYQLDALLQTARDYHAKFTDNQIQNIALLQALKSQREDAIKAFEIGKTQMNK